MSRTEAGCQCYLTLPGPQAAGCGQQKLHPLGLRGLQWDSSFLPNMWPAVCYSIASRLHQLNVYVINNSQTSQPEWLTACNVSHTCAHNVCPPWDIPPLRAERARVERTLCHQGSRGAPYTNPAPCPMGVRKRAQSANHKLVGRL